MDRVVLTEDELGCLVARTAGHRGVHVVVRRLADRKAWTHGDNARASGVVSWRDDGSLRLVDGCVLELDPMGLDIR